MNEDIIEELTEKEIQQLNNDEIKLKNKYGEQLYQLIKLYIMVCPKCNNNIDWLQKEKFCLNCFFDLKEYFRNVKIYFNKINIIKNYYKRRCKLCQ
jgi:hypothetical protein